MKQHEEVFFKVLRTALWGKTLEVPQYFRDWSAVLKMAHSQALMGLIGNVFLSHPHILSTFSSKAQVRLMDFLFGNVAAHTTLNNTLVLAVTTLRKHGVEPVLLKGQGLAQFYPVPQLRQCGDIDLYVGEENYEKAYDALLPILTKVDPKEDIWKCMHFHADIGSVQLEIHKQADYVRAESLKDIYHRYMIDGLTGPLPTVELSGEKVRMPSVNYNAFYVFYHLWRHFSTSGVGLRQFCDLMFYLHAKHDEIDLKYLEKILTDMNLMKIWKVFGGVIVDVLGLPENEYPFYDNRYRGKTKYVVKYVLTDGNFGVHTGYSRVRKNRYLVEKWFSFKCHLSRSFRMFYIFPAHSMRRFTQMFSAGMLQVIKDIFRKQ